MRVLFGLSALLLAPAAQAQVTPIGPFVGDYSDDMEAQPTAGFQTCLDVGNPTDVGDVCASDMNATTGWSYTCSLSPHGGNVFTGATGGIATYDFTVPVQQFGGYFATNAGVGFTMTVRFYDTSGNLVDTVVEPLQNCGWDWFGWSSPVTIATIEFEGSTGGGFVMMDDIEITELAIPDADGDGYTIDQGDCDDGNPYVFPGATEVCNGFDDDCDGNLPLDEQDSDGDGVIACEDCDDNDNTAYPGNSEVCDGVDNDCDGSVDPGEVDDDGDGVSECQGDCDDTDPARTPGAAEICDGIDNDCDGSITSDELDNDGDGFGICDGDCDDTTQAMSPGNAEIPGDGIDNNCDGSDGALEGATGTGTGTAPAIDPKPGGCGCATGTPATGWVALLPGLLLLRRRD